MKSQTIAILLLFLVSNSSDAQNQIYHLNRKKDAAIVAGGMGLLIGGYVVNSTVKKVTAADINLLNKNDVPAFDRKAIDNNSKSAQKISDVLLYSSMVLPLTIYLSQNSKNEYTAITVMGVEAAIYTGGFTSIMKATIKRYRPYAYNTNLTMDERINLSTRKSFPSGHVSTTAVASFFTAKVLTDLYPESKYKPLIWTAAVVIPAATGFLRYKAGKHFASDVLGGYVLGAGIGYLVPALHKSKNVSLGMSPTGGANLTWVF